ncbi:DUF2523 family protein [Chromobacterium sp. TRC.1.1.SA]|uniref:DUF2523 family protein n=1 Tax=Chromobacterium indicum TaxID=3110228 RepID=A0ABV0CS72_9NEIS
MPVIIAICSAVAVALLTNLVSRVIGAIGFGMVGYIGINSLFSALKSTIAANVSGMVVNVFAIAGLAGFGQAISIMFSALIIRATLAGMDSAGSMIQSKWKGFKA